MTPKTFHCLLCEHSKKDFTTGAYCGLTNEKPNFSTKCPSKEFGIQLEQEIIKVNKELAVVKTTKTKTMLHVYTYLSFAIIILLADYFLSSYLYEKGSINHIYVSSYYIVAIPLIIAAAGFYLIPFSIAPLNKYKRELKLAIESKTRLDKILKIYGYSYDFDITINKGPHDILDIETKLEINN